MAGAYSYEQAFTIMRKLRLSKAEAAEQFRRMVFNVLSRNLDDHTKNISFIMTPDGKWRLSPAYDITYAHNPKGKWTDRHQMSINGKRDNITKEDLLQVADSISLHKAGDVIEEIQAALEKWTEFAQTARVKPSVANEIRRNFIAI
jgi:serine/threonine-protein kinase HipA